MNIYDFIEKHGRKKTESLLRGLRSCEGSKACGAEFYNFWKNEQELLRCIDTKYILMYGIVCYSKDKTPGFDDRRSYAVSSDYKLPTERECRSSQLWKKAVNAAAEIGEMCDFAESIPQYFCPQTGQLLRTPPYNVIRVPEPCHLTGEALIRSLPYGEYAICGKRVLIEKTDVGNKKLDSVPQDTENTSFIYESDDVWRFKKDFEQYIVRCVESIRPCDILRVDECPLKQQAIRSGQSGLAPCNNCERRCF